MSSPVATPAVTAEPAPPDTGAGPDERGLLRDAPVSTAPAEGHASALAGNATAVGAPTRWSADSGCGCSAPG